MLALVVNVAVADDQSSISTADRQSLDDAWWTGPILAASAGTLPKGHFLIEPYLFDVITQARFDEDGNRHRADEVHSFGSLTYLLYGLTDSVTVGLIPYFGFNEVSNGKDSSGIGVGDLTLQAQYGLTQFREGHWLPATSLVLQHTLPTGTYDRLGDRPSDGFGDGAHTTTVALYSQSYFWLPNGRILRTRLNLAQSFSDDASVEDVSVYGTSDGFRGHAEPGDSFTINAAWEYSLTRNWVLALDAFYQERSSTHLRGYSVESIDGEPQRVDVRVDSGSSHQVGFAPAIEYNWSSTMGVIIGVRWIASGRNASASITPVAAINIVY